MVTGQAPVPVHASGFSIDRRGAVRRIARVHLEREVSETVFLALQLTGGRPTLARNCWKAGTGCRLLKAGSDATLTVSSACRS
jgi:hypothetical protein